MNAFRAMQVSPLAIVLGLGLWFQSGSPGNVCAEATSSYDVQFVKPSVGYRDLTLDGSAEVGHIATGIKIFDDGSQNAYSVMDMSQQFKTAAGLRKMQDRFKQAGSTTSFNTSGSYEILVVERKTDRFITHHYFATGTFGYGVLLNSPDKGGLVFKLEKGQGTIEDHSTRTLMTSDGMPAKCDICMEEQRAGGYALDNDTVLSSDSYVDWYIAHHKKKGNIPADAVVTDDLRRQVRQSLVQSVGETPWLVCDRCMKSIFIKQLKEPKRALHYRSEATRLWSGVKITNESCKYAP